MQAIKALVDYVKALDARVLENDLSSGTHKYYRLCLARFVAPLSDKEMSEIDDCAVLSAWQAFLNDCADLRPRSVRTYREVCCCWLDWCVAMGLLKYHTLRRVKPPKLDVANRPKISLYAFKSLLAAVDRLEDGHDDHTREYNAVRARALLWTAWSGLMRHSELRNLRVDNLRLNGDPPEVLIERGKGRSSAWVPLSDDAVTALRAWIQKRGDCPSEWLWVNAGVKRLRMGHEAWPLVLKTLGRIASADITQCKTHGTRRGAATAMLRSGIDYATVSKALRHAHISTTEIYVEADAVRVAEVRNWMDKPQPDAKQPLSLEEAATALLEIREWIARQGPPEQSGHSGRI